jgi:hypothetical protein
MRVYCTKNQRARKVYSPTIMDGMDIVIHFHCPCHIVIASVYCTQWDYRIIWRYITYGLIVHPHMWQLLYILHLLYHQLLAPYIPTFSRHSICHSRLLLLCKYFQDNYTLLIIIPFQHPSQCNILLERAI